MKDTTNFITAPVVINENGIACPVRTGGNAHTPPAGLPASAWGREAAKVAANEAASEQATTDAEFSAMCAAAMAQPS